MYTGLWTSTGMPNIKAEVGTAGTRVCKTDVGWIGAGYKYERRTIIHYSVCVV